MTQRTFPMVLALLLISTPALAQYNTIHTSTTYTDRSPGIPVYAYDETAVDALNQGYPLDADSHTLVDIAPSSGTYTKRTVTTVQTDRPYQETHTVTTTRTTGPAVTYRDGADVDRTVVT